ncbi:MAG: adenylate/guanylate cyclase domain-containing protein [Proteobacteria bacterium]|nr:adenylate/guanylate cyclase domain-containing protein [Pseudomonadota bacterium]
MLARIGNFFRKAFSVDRLMGLALLAVFLFLYVTDPYPVEFLRLKTFDYYQKLKPREIPPPERKPVTIIDLDEASLSEIGQWPWPRNILARMVENLMEMGAVMVAFDMVFAEPDRMNPAVVADSIAGLDEETKEKLRRLPGNDEKFAEVIKKSRVVLGQAGYWEERETKAGPPVKKSIALLKKGKNVEPANFLPNFKSLIRNIPVIEKAALGHGIFSLVPEPDGIVRRIPTLFVFDGKLYPSLSVEMLRVAFQRKTILVRADPAGVTAMKIAPKRVFPPNGLSLPTDAKGRVWPYFSKSDKAKYVSARDVLAGTADPALIKGKMTIVGTSAVGLLDIRSSPVDAIIPGVEVHVQLIEAALTGKYLSRPANFRGAELLLILVGGLLMIWLVPKVGAKWTILLFLVVGGAAAGASGYLFVEKRQLLDVGFGIIAIFLIYALLTFTGYVKEEAQKRQTRQAFSKYLSPAMVEKVAEDPSQLKLGGVKRDLTLLFCDVRGFTTISEQFDAVGLTSLINKLLTPLTNVILNSQGTVDKYMGDCIMAFWNAPLDDEDHARNGCLSALDMLAEIAPLNERLKIEAVEEGRKHIPLKVGFGLNTGECVVGNMGSDQRFDYSVLGDTVNLAARLEGQSKSYGVDIVIGEGTRKLVTDLASIELDRIQVKGKTVPVDIFALLGDDKVAQSEEFKKLSQANQAMIDAYRAQDWEKTRTRIAECRELLDGFNVAGLYDLYEQRVEDYEATPPDADWGGVFIATTK